MLKPFKLTSITRKNLNYTREFKLRMSFKLMRKKLNYAREFKLLASFKLMRKNLNYA